MTTNPSDDKYFADKLGQELTDLQFDGHQTSQTPVIEQQVDEVLLILHLQTVLAADKGEAPAHGAKKGLDTGN